MPDSNAGSVDFTTLVLSLQQSAFLLMGLKEEEGMNVEVDLDGARVQIDLLSMLQEKTSGNLSDEEERLLRTVLYELRTAFVDTKNAR
jgi:hypothetical protein